MKFTITDHETATTEIRHSLVLDVEIEPGKEIELCVVFIEDPSEMTYRAEWDNIREVPESYDLDKLQERLWAEINEMSNELQAMFSTMDTL